MRKTLAISVCGLALAGVIAVIWICAPGGRLQVSILFLGYTNQPNWPDAGVLQISNAGPFAIVRGRSPQVVYDLANVPATPAPTGWAVLQARECEEIHTESLTNGLRWHFQIVCERLGGDSYGIGPPDFRARLRRIAIWLTDHGIHVPEPAPRLPTKFLSGWIEPPVSPAEIVSSGPNK